MRARFVAALLAPALLAAPGRAFSRQPIEPGDTVLGDILLPYDFDEYPLVLARGSTVTMTATPAAPGSLLPGVSLLTADYAAVEQFATGPNTSRSAPVTSSGVYRLLTGARVGAEATVGGYRGRFRVSPQRSFSLQGTPQDPATTLVLGAYAGFELRVALRWKGPAPVTIRSLAGPTGPLASAEAPRTGARSSVQGGFASVARGDHTLDLDVPDGTESWSATVAVAGRLPRGTTRDLRTVGAPEPPTVAFPSAGYYPVIVVEGETGGPNGLLLASAGDSPDGQILDDGRGSGGCARLILPEGTADDVYEFRCANGFRARVEVLARDGLGRIETCAATSVVTPLGSGSATLTGLTYDAQGRADGWTEVRRFDATGRSHELVVSAVERFPNGGLRAFRVVHRLLPGGTPRVHDYAPFR